MQKLRRAFWRALVTRRWLFAPLVQLARPLHALLPPALRTKIPALRATGTWPRGAHARKVILLRGCVQPALLPSIDAATARVLDALGVQAIVVADSGCCGAIDYHTDARTAAVAKARRNIDAWWPLLESGVESIVINASGCGAMIKDYAHLLRDDAAYAQKAERIRAATCDTAEFLAPFASALAQRVGAPAATRIAFHPPCTLQHTQKLRGVTEALLAQLGARLAPVTDAHLCCGAAGTYALLQPELSGELRARKLRNLASGQPQMILSANVGCLAHLQTGTPIPVRHWIEWVDAAISRRPAAGNL